MLVKCNWEAGGIGFLSICEVNSLQVFVPHLEFPSSIAFEFCFSEDVRLI